MWKEFFSSHSDNIKKSRKCLGTNILPFFALLFSSSLCYPNFLLIFNRPLPADNFSSQCLTNWLIDWLTHWLTDWLIDWLTNWLADWLISWLTNWLTYLLIDWLTNWLTDWPNKQNYRFTWVDEICNPRWCRSLTQ